MHKVWEAVSEFDPRLTAARTAPEILESLKMKSTAIIEDKKVIRKQKKERNDSEEGCWDAVGSLGLLEL